MSNNLHSIMYYENNVQSPIRTYRVIAIHEHQAIFQLLDLCSTNQIPFCHIRLRFTRCHFQVNNPLFLTYSKRIIQPHWKKINMEPNATDSEFATQFSHALTFNIILFFRSVYIHLCKIAIYFWLGSIGDTT